MKKLLLVLILLFFVGCGKNTYTNITALEFLKSSNNSEFFIIDVRSNLEFAHDHIDEAINVELEDIEKYISEVVPNKNSKVIVYCQTGRRSALASEKLVELGYNNIYNLVGGIEAFKEVSN